MIKSVQIIGFLLPLILFCACSHSTEEVHPLEKRGIVLYPSDILSLGAGEWVRLLEGNHLNLLGIHADSRHETLPKLKSFLDSEEGRNLLRECRKRNIDIEFELHILREILPRELFDDHPEYFRMDSTGKRQREFNMCFTSDEAYREIENNLSGLLQWLKPTTHRYFLWTDDVNNAFCHCPSCARYSESEQALIYENRLLSILKKTDPMAKVAHLAYVNTLKAPQKVIPEQGVFLEYAPIARDYSKPLPEVHLSHLKENLKVFPASTAHILEYWLDVSMFSRWDRHDLKRIPWDQQNCRRDVALYRKLGIGSITTFGAWMNRDYIRQYGSQHRDQMLNEYGKALTGARAEEDH